jgi:two-component system, chemotaxis family, sensor kinase CheA
MSPSMPDQPADFVAPFMEDFFAEAEEHLMGVRHSLLLIESAVGGDPPAAVVEELFRSFHSLKGISAMVELREAERLAHEMESCLVSIRDRQFVLNAPRFEALVDAAHMLEQVIVARRARSTIPPVDHQIARLIEACGAGTPAADAAAVPFRTTSSPIVASRAAGRYWRVTFTPSPDLVARGIMVDVIRGRLAEIGRIESVVPRVTTGGGIAFDFQVQSADERAFLAWRDDGITYEALSPMALPIPIPSLDSPVAPAIRAADPAPAVTNFVRIDLARLDDLMRLVGDLVVSRARLEDTLLRVERFLPGEEWRSLQDETESIQRELRDLREAVMRVRLVPVAEIFRRMPFVVRDLARESGRRIHLEMSGQATEIDKFLIERMMDPMLHLVRNAVSHGIEMPEERAAAGKRPDGTIRLAASTVGESVVLEVSDDGRGMNTETIVRRARAAGLGIADGDIDSRVLLDVICSPGFSTRDEADRASGRGVGMAVVRDAVQDLGGTLSVDSVAGRGTTFRALLPLTLAITEALIVHASDRTFAVPQGAVREVTEVDRTDLRALENNELMTHRGAALPVVRLSQLFSLEPTSRQRMHVIVVGTGPAAVGILVDRISGQREIVVKTLRDPLVRVAGVSGATELGDGRLVLILDLAGLTRKLRGRNTPVRAAM